MIDVGGNDGAAGGHFMAHELRRDVVRQVGAPALARVLVAQHLAANALAPHVFTDGDELHLRGDDAGAGIVQLGHAPARQRLARQRQMFEAQMIQPLVRQPLLGEAGAGAAEGGGIAARVDPAGAQFGETGVHVELGLRIAVGAGGVIHRDRLVGFILRVVFAAAEQGRAELNFAHRHLDIAARALQIDTA